MSTIEEKKKELNNESKDKAEWKKFFSNLGITILSVSLFALLGSIFYQNITLYSKKPLQGTELYGPPYTPSQPFEGVTYEQYGGSNIFSNIFNMDDWAFPYKNVFTKPYPKNDKEAQKNWKWRIGSWVTMSVAFSFASGRHMLQQLFDSLNKVTTTGKTANLFKVLLFIQGHLVMLLLMGLVPLFSVITTTWGLVKNFYKLVPNNIILAALLIIPIIFLASSASFIIVPSVVLIQFIILAFFLYIYPLLSINGLREISQLIYENRFIITNMLLFGTAFNAFNNLGTLPGITVVIAWLGYAFKLI